MQDEYSEVQDGMVKFKNPKTNEEVFYNKKTNKIVKKTENSVEKSDITKKIGSYLGLRPTIVNAAKDSDYTDSGKVKRTLVATYNKGDDFVKCSLVYNWVKDPKYTLTDEMAMYVKNGTPVYSSVSVSYTHDMLNYYSGLVSFNFAEKAPTSIKNNSGVAIKQTLCPSAGSVYNTNHKLSISYKAKIDNMKSWKYVEVDGQYYHQQATVSCNPSLSLNSDGTVSFASVSIRNKFQELTNPLQVFCYFK